MIAALSNNLLAKLAEIPDPRGRHGRRHSISAMLAAVVCGLLSGATGCAGIAQWLHAQPTKVWHLLGFFRKPPTENCFRNLLTVLPSQTLEAALTDWIGGLIGGIEQGEIAPVDLDGKSLCNTLQRHGQSIHLLSLLDHATGGVLAQLSMPPETNEHKAALLLLKQIALDGRLITGDAMFCQRDLCQQIIDSGGDYLVTVKDNQPELKEAIVAEFQPGCSPLH